MLEEPFDSLLSFLASGTTSSPRLLPMPKVRPGRAGPGVSTKRGGRGNSAGLSLISSLTEPFFFVVFFPPSLNQTPSKSHQCAGARGRGSFNFGRAKATSSISGCPTKSVCTERWEKLKRNVPHKAGTGYFLPRVHYGDK